MPIRRIILPLNGTETGHAALATALLVARQFNAHVTALHVRADSREVAPLAGEGLSGAMVEEMMSAAEREMTLRSRQVTSAFEAFVRAHEVTLGEARHGQEMATASLRLITGREDDIVAQQTRLADLAVVPHPDAAELSSSDALHAVLFDSGRPVIVAPKYEPGTLGKRIAIAWNGVGRECHRGARLHALADAGRRGPGAAFAGLPAARAGGDRAAVLSDAAQCRGRHRRVPAGGPRDRGRAARGRPDVRRRPDVPGRLLAFAPPPVDPRRGSRVTCSNSPICRS